MQQGCKGLPTCHWRAFVFFSHTARPATSQVKSTSSTGTYQSLPAENFQAKTTSQKGSHLLWQCAGKRANMTRDKADRGGVM